MYSLSEYHLTCKGTSFVYPSNLSWLTYLRYSVFCGLITVSLNLAKVVTSRTRFMKNHAGRSKRLVTVTLWIFKHMTNL